MPVRVLVVGATDARAWREKFAGATLESLDAGGAVWVSNRLLAAAPERDWNWTEGDARGVRWADFPEFFSRLEFVEAPAGAGGFSRVAPTPANRAGLAKLCSPAN